MEMFDQIDNQMLGAFVDGHLDPAHCETIIKAMEDDPEIRERVYELRRAKDLMKLGFSQASAPSRMEHKPAFWRKYPSAIAAMLVLAVGFAGGWLIQPAPSIQQHDAAQAQVQVNQGDKIIVHISKSDPKQFANTLAYHQIDVVAHASGLDLMRTDVSPLKQQILALMDKHDNVHFIACAGAIKKFHKKNGEAPDIIHGVKTDMTAFDHIVGRLQSGGWKYIKAETLSET
jgi:intracellular sulfur oxidation DsrE/DsrF family protein